MKKKIIDHPKDQKDDEEIIVEEDIKRTYISADKTTPMKTGEPPRAPSPNSPSTSPWIRAVLSDYQRAHMDSDDDD